MIVAVAVPVAAFVIIFIAVVACCYSKKKKQIDKKHEKFVDKTKVGPKLGGDQVVNRAESKV